MKNKDCERRNISEKHIKSCKVGIKEWSRFSIEYLKGKSGNIEFKPPIDSKPIDDTFVFSYKRKNTPFVLEGIFCKLASFIPPLSILRLIVAFLILVFSSVGGGDAPLHIVEMIYNYSYIPVLVLLIGMLIVAIRSLSCRKRFSQYILNLLLLGKDYIINNKRITNYG